VIQARRLGTWKFQSALEERINERFPRRGGLTLESCTQIRALLCRFSWPAGDVASLKATVNVPTKPYPFLPCSLDLHVYSKLLGIDGALITVHNVTRATSHRGPLVFVESKAKRNMLMGKWQNRGGYIRRSNACHPHRLGLH
jgi:hypothetical protein